MSTSFVVIVALMALAALAAILWPYLAHAPRGQRLPAVLLTIAGIPLLAGGLYATLSEWNWNATTDSGEVPAAVQKMIEGLEARLQAEPRDLDGWLMLGRSYFELNRFAQATEAYQRAYTLSRGGNVEAVLGLGEAMAFDDQTTLTGPAAELFEQGLELEPQHPKALWYSGLVAHQQGNLALARERWSALAALNPPPEVKELLQTKLMEIDVQLAASGEAPAGRQVAATGGVVRVRVSIAPELAGKIAADAPLFVLARAVGTSGGPPVAVKRLSAGQLPLLVELTDQDAMIAGRGLSGMDKVTVVARIALGGTPQARSGDFQGELEIAVGGEVVELSIDSIVP